MKFRYFSSFRLDRTLRRTIASVLREGETVASFREEAIRLELARRQSVLDPTTDDLVSAAALVDAAKVQDGFLMALVSELKTSTARAAASLDRTIQRLDEPERLLPQFEAAACKSGQHEFADLRR